MLACGAEGQQPKESGSDAISPGLWCYLPGTPAIQVWPVASRVELTHITSGSRPEVHIGGASGPYTVSGTVYWNGIEFVSIQTAETAPHFAQALYEIESGLFQRQRYRVSLDELNSIEYRVGRSSLSEVDQADMLHEIYYHQAICYRKLGDVRHAEVILSALQRMDPYSPWGSLAGSWLGGSGLPGTPIEINMDMWWILRRWI